MKEILNIGVLGCAKIAERSVIPAILELNNLYHLVGIASREVNKAVDFAKKFNTRSFDGYQSLIDCTDLDAIYIPLPNSLHAEWIEKALNNGKNILVEKSMACNYQDVIRLNNLAREKGLVLVENFQFRFHSQLQAIQKMLNDGLIGELRCIRSSFGFPGLPTETDIRYQLELGGGALLDAGAYPIKLAQIFMGHDIEVKAASLNKSADKVVDIWGGAYLKQNNGDLFAEIAFGFHHFYQCNIELWGSKAKLFSNRIFTANATYKPIVEIETALGKEIITLDTDNHFNNMLIHFSELIMNKHECECEDEYKQNIHQARLINEIKTRSNE